MLGIINRRISYLLKQYQNYIDHILDLTKNIVFSFKCIPITVKDADMVERLQRRATKNIQTLRNLYYKERLKGWLCFFSVVGDSGMI